MLYHGSKTLISDGYLKPNICYELESFVYATDNYEYALIRSGNFDITKPEVREEHEPYNGGWYHELCEIWPGSFKRLFDRPGYIYVLHEYDFSEQFRESEYVSRNEVKIARTIFIPNILKELEKSDTIKLIYNGYEGYYWSHVKGGKEGYLQRKQSSAQEVLNKRNGA